LIVFPCFKYATNGATLNHFYPNYDKNIAVYFPYEDFKPPIAIPTRAGIFMDYIPLRLLFFVRTPTQTCKAWHGYATQNATPCARKERRKKDPCGATAGACLLHCRKENAPTQILV
jgi:hypothetical protein